MKKSLDIIFGCLIVLFGFSANILLAQPACTITATSTGDWDNTGTWSTTALPSNTDVVCWNNNLNIHFPQFLNYTGSFNTVTIATMEMGQSDNLYIGQGDGVTDRLIISGNFYDGNASVIYIASDGILEIDGNLNVNNGLTLVVTGGGQLIVNGTVNIANSASLILDGNVTIGGNFTIGNSGTISVPSGGSVSVGGNVNAGNATCANIVGSFTVGGTCSGGGANCSSSTSGGSGIGFCSALPIKLISFEGINEKQTIKLKWATASEINFDFFTIEKSGDGKQFIEIAKINGHGNSNIKIDYSFEDEKPFMGRNFYRLTTTDYDHTVTRFQVIAVDHSSAKTVSIYPNPISDKKINFEFNYLPATTSKAYIYNLQGNLISILDLKNQSEEFIHSLQPGMYIIKVVSDDLNSIERIVVQEKQ